MKIAALLMVKNESKRVHVTVRSVSGLDGLIVYDTGSTDDTIDIIKRESVIPVHVRETQFKNFALSRNESLEFANECGYDYLFILDCNDELRFDREALDRSLKDNKHYECWYVERRLKYSADEHVSFQDVKLVKCPVQFRYKGSVHEYLDGCRMIGKLSEIVAHIYQDRTADDDKSSKRWARDEELLKKDFEDDPSSTRALFYLAQTCSCLGKKREAFDYYERRTRSVGGFEEERWQSMVHCGTLSTDPFDAISWYVKATAHSERAEPLVYAAKLLIGMKKYVLAYSFAKLACDADFPSRSILFIERRVYDYERWHVLGICAYYAALASDNVSVRNERLLTGRDACVKAINSGNNIALDEANLKYYVDKLQLHDVSHD